jgi:hypothetical protein
MFQFDSAGFSAGYCFYTVIDAVTKKVVNFTVTTKDMVPYSALMGINFFIYILLKFHLNAAYQILMVSTLLYQRIFRMQNNIYF